MPPTASSFALSSSASSFFTSAFSSFGAPSTARGLYELDPNTLVATQVLSYSTNGISASISGLGFNRADGLFYAPDDVGLQIVAIDLATGTATPVPGSAYVSGSADVDGCTVGNNKVYLIDDALALEQAGAFAIVLEKVPATLGKRMAEATSVPIIGIGAGPHTDGQILVTHDMLGMFTRFQPRFVRRYRELAGDIGDAISGYCEDVRGGRFPSDDESY